MYKSPRMRLTYCLVLALISWCVSSLMVAVQASDNPFLTREGHLVSTLELRDAQEGFVGVTGTIWTVEPDGTFRVTRFVNEHVKAPHSQGRLHDDEIARIAETLVAQHFRSLPHEIGQAPPVNARRIILQFDDKTASAVLEPRQSLAAAAANSRTEPETARAYLLTIVETVHAILEAKR